MVSQSASGAPAISDARPTPRVLIVDDEPMVRELIAAHLAADGSISSGVGSGEEALALLDREPFDLVILDVGLPNMSGFDVCRQIRTRSDVPVIFVTAAGNLAERLHGFDLGGDDYIVKPMDAAELHRRVRAVLRRHLKRDDQPAEVAGPDGVTMNLRAHEVLVHGEELTLISLAIDGRTLSEGDYVLAPDSLTIAQPPASFSLEIETEIRPGENTKLDGLYVSGGVFCTQCEAEGFRRISFFPDRPDVMAVYTTTIRAARARYPVLLSNGNLVAEEDLGDGVWQLPVGHSGRTPDAQRGHLEIHVRPVHRAVRRHR